MSDESLSERTHPDAEKTTQDFVAAQHRLASKLREADLQHARRQVQEAKQELAKVQRKLSQATAALSELERRG